MPSDSLESAQNPIFVVDADSFSHGDPWKEFESRRRSAEYYLNQYLKSLDRISQTCADFDTSPTTAVSIPAQSQTDTDMTRLKICTDTAIRDLTVMENILRRTQENPKLQSQPWSHTAAICTCALCISAVVAPYKAAVISGVGALIGAATLAVPPIWKSVQCNHIDSALHNVQDLKEAFARGTVNQVNRLDLEPSEFSKLKGMVSNHSREIGDS
ncbi:hypothetical protein FPOA_03678 [Fusarium poae]|uniref:Uncharacterized protein n=1 Tax=Fusarium poae TaxID=36050 RepID=A0A1B8ARD9_FUSPO|nr:hypothetical protein FPOA_03678 [Fusarium poae]